MLRLDAEGWRLEAGGWSSAVQCAAVRCGAVRCRAVRCGAVRLRCGAAASRRAWLIFCILRLHTSPVVSENLLCMECQFLVIKSRIPSE